MTKPTRFPSALVTGDYAANSLILDGGSVIDQCIVTAGERSTFFLEQHLLWCWEVVSLSPVDVNNGQWPKMR